MITIITSIGVCLLTIAILLGWIKRMTIPYLFVLYAILGTAVFFISPIVSGIAFFCLLGLIYKKWKLKNAESDTEFDFSDVVYSLSMRINQLKKPKHDTIVIGEVLPIGKRELPYNKAKISVDDTILSGATLLTGATGSGKALHKSTPIPTPTGFSSLEHIKVGDKVFDRNGKPTTVTEKHHPNDIAFYEVVFADGTIVRASGGHLWDIEGHGLRETWELSRQEFPLYIRTTSAVEYEDTTPLPIDPFVFGEFISTCYIPPNLRTEFARLGLSPASAHIPVCYLITSVSNRWAFLNGVRNGGGNTERTIMHSSWAVLDVVRIIANSLGFITSDIRHQATDGMYAFDTNVKTKESYHSIVAINKINGANEDYYCIGVDSETHMFLCTERFIPTHNTTSLLSIIKQTLKQDKPVVFFDYKGETDILDDLEAYATKLGVPYYEFSSRRCDISYDPLINLNETGRVEALMNTRRWDASGADEHYKTSTQLAIQNVVRGYDKERAETGDTRNYIIGLRDFAYIYKPGPNERDGVSTLAKQLDILLTSRAQLLFNNEGEEFSFENMNGPCIVCFSFVSANKQLANSLSSFIFQDILDRGTRKRYEPKLLLCIDEFGTLESSTLIKDIVEKGRSGGCQTIFSILDINQISMSAGEHFVNAILGTINSFVIHAGATQQTADLLAGVQKYSNKGYSIMDLRKPYKGRPPTALFISKYPLLNKKGNQEMYRIIPYSGNRVDRGIEKKHITPHKDSHSHTAQENAAEVVIMADAPQPLVEAPTSEDTPTTEIKTFTINDLDQYL